MKNTLRDLLDRNPFNELNLPVSATGSELRRAVEQAKLEVSMGIRPVGEEELAFFEQSLLREPNCFEMRLLADWGDDRVLSKFSEPHHGLITIAQKAVNDGVRSTDGIWAPVVWAAGNPELTLALQDFVPSGIPLENLWGDLLAELLREGTIRKGEPIPPEAVPYAGTWPGVNLASVFSLACSSVQQDFDGLADEIPRTPPESPPVGEVYSPWAENFEALVLRLTALARRTGDAPLEAARESAVNAALHVSTVFHNAGLFGRAEAVLTLTLELPLTDAQNEHLNGDLRVVRLAKCHRDFGEAMERKDSLGAQAALRGVVDNTDDPAERASALEAIQRLHVSGIPRAGAPTGGRFWARYRGWAIAAAIVVAALALLGFLASVPEESSASSSRSNPSGDSSPPPPASDPEVGDCIRDTASGLRTVSCSTANDGTVVAVKRLSGSVYRESSVTDQANRLCPSSADSFFYPTRTSWEQGDRSVLCIRE